MAVMKERTMRKVEMRAKRRSDISTRRLGGERRFAREGESEVSGVVRRGRHLRQASMLARQGWIWRG